MLIAAILQSNITIQMKLKDNKALLEPFYGGNNESLANPINNKNSAEHI